MDPAERHELEWTPRQIRQFWNYHGSMFILEDQYFAGMMGRSLLDYVAARANIGTAVDIGCGRGHLLRFLMHRGCDAYGADQSPVSVEKVNADYAGMPHFKGATIGTNALPDALADTVFMVEVVEHLDDEALSNALHEAYRLLKPGGHLVLTTPNDEDLEASKIICPNCLAVFHKVQHVRSWTADSLAKQVEAHGFTSRSAEGWVLTRYSGLLDKLYRFLYLLRHSGTRPNLVYVGTKN